MSMTPVRQTWLDQAISWFSPSWGLKRSRARSAAAVLLSYEGARVDRRTAGWLTSDTSANTEIGPALSWLRQRARDLVRNNAYGARAVAELAGQAVGTGIRATAVPRNGDKALKQQIKDAWDIWCDECDADGQLDFYGLQRLVVRTVIESGECLIRKRPRYPDDGFHVPLQLQVLEPDYLDTNKTVDTQTGTIIQGVEFDLLGRRIAYWLFPRHPGDAGLSYARQFSITSQRVPAELILHVYQKDRQQVRGVPWFAPVVIHLRDLDEYREAEIVRKKIEACFATFVTQAEGPEGPSLGEVQPEQNGDQSVEALEPGIIRYLKPGEEVSFGQPTGHGEGYRDFMRDMQTEIASGLGLTYEQLTGDLSNVNYSSYRAGLLSFRTGIEVFRWLNFIPMFCRPVRRWFISAAYVAQRIPALEYGTKWSPPGFGSVDPQKDANAMQTRVRNGTQTWEQAVADEGYDPEEQIEEIKRTNEAMDANGIVLDCDPRKRTSTGQAISAGPAKETQQERPAEQPPAE